MKKLLLLVAVIMAGCTDAQKARMWEEEGFTTLTFDSCEYIFGTAGYKGFLAHKGNCRFCAERRKQETKELINELFNMQER